MPTPSTSTPSSSRPIPEDSETRRRTLGLRSVCRTALALVLPLVFVLPLACGGTAVRGGLAGEDRPLDLTTEELWTVGGIEAQGWQTFSDRISVAFDQEGRLRIFDRLGGRIHLVGADGELVRSWGEKGEGPGELSSPMSMLSWRDGSSAVLDLGKMGYVRFDPNGEYVEDVRIDPTKGLPGFSGMVAHPSGDVVSEGGGIVMNRSGPGSNTVEQPEPIGIPITRYSFAGGDPTTLHRAWDPPEPEGGRDVTLGGGGTVMRIQMPTPIAFQPDLHFGVLPDGRLVVADSTTWTIEVLAEDGTILDTISRPIPPILVDEAMKTAERDRRLAEIDAREEGGGGGGGAVNIGGGGGNVAVIRMEGGGGGGGTFDVSGVIDSQRDQIESMLFAPELPVIDRLAVDWAGRIWVERKNADLTEDGPIDIVEPDGGYVGTIASTGLRIPSAFGPDGLAAYIDMDEFDVPTVRVVRVRGISE